MNEHLLPGDASPDDNRSSDTDGPSGPGEGRAGGSSFGAGLGDSAASAPAADGDAAPRARKKPRRRKKAASRSAAEAPAETSAETSDGRDAPPRARASSKASEEVDGASADEDAPKRPARKRKPRRKKAARATAAAKAPDDEPDESDERERSEDVDEAPEPARKKAGRTRRRAARKDADDAEPDDGDAPESSSEDAEEDTDSEGAARKRRRRGSRGGRRRKAARAEGDSRTRSAAVAAEALPGEDDDLPPSDDDDSGSEAPARKKRRRRKRKASGGARSTTDRESDEDDEERDEDEEPARGRATKKKRSRSRRKTSTEDEKTDEELEAEEEALRTQTILVNAVEPEEKRVVVIEGERIVDLLMTAESQKTLVNDVYRGKVVNLEPAIGAAFIDFGQGRNGFLHTSDVLPVYGEDGFKLEQLLTARVDEEHWEDDERLDVKDLDDDDPDEESEDDGDEKPKAGRGRAKSSRSKSSKPKASRERRKSRDRRPISDLLRVGDPVVVQVTKDAIGDKGPTLTTYISIPGRYLVLMPSMSRTGVSRKIPDEKERRRLKRILTSLNAPEDMGVIVRTAGIGKKKTDLGRDLNYLLGVWEGFGKKLRSSRGPSALYRESDVATRTLRDLFNARTQRVVVDDYAVHEQMVEFADKLMPDQRERIELYDGDRPIFHQYSIEQDFEKVFTRRVDLPSGGSIVFDQAEALVAIDVNSGRTRTDSFDFEKIALKTNLEAVPEIALQIKLRDLGGILVCDFIDMMKPSSNRQVERALRTELADDRARSKLGRISQFGLLEMTRQRLGPGTHKKVFQACPRCRGTGRVRTLESRAQAILRRLGSALTQKGFSSVEVRAHPEVVQYLKEDLYDYVRALEHRTEREIRFTGVADQSEDSVLRYLRADGREVRPGGRRKK